MKKTAAFFCILFAAVFVFAQKADEAPGSALALYEGGRAEQSRSSHLAAVKLYRASLKENPDYVLPMIGLAESFFALEEYEESLAYLKTAQIYDRSNLDLLVLEGRIAIARNQPAKARELFETVLERQKNNLEARFGLAELDIAQGRIREASKRYIETLKIRPQSQKALLSLALLSESESDQEAAEAYLELALKYHTYDPRVHFAAARFAIGKGKPDRAERYLLTAIALNPKFSEARRLLAQVYLLQDYPDKAVTVLREILDEDREIPSVWYTLGLAYDRSGNTEQAIRSLAQVLRLRPDDEIARIALENIALEKLPIQDPVRQRYAAYHIERGTLFQEHNLLDKALLAYRRALRLQPESKEARLLYAGLYRIMGFPGKYKRELEVLRDLGYEDTVISDDIEIIESSNYDSVAARWAIDQYGLEKKRYSIALYHLATASRTMHSFSGQVTAEYLKDLLQRYPDLALMETALNVDHLDSAFAEARQAAADYFLVAHIEESERSFTVVLDMHLAGTGKLLRTFRVFRTGNDRVQDCFNIIADRFHEILPLKATLLVRQFDRGVIDLGTNEGLEQAQEFAIVKKGRVQIRHDTIGLTTEEQQVIGTFTVTELDEQICEGTIAKKSFFDHVNSGDEIILLPSDSGPEGEQITEEEDTGLFRRLLGLIGL